MRKESFLLKREAYKIFGSHLFSGWFTPSFHTFRSKFQFFSSNFDTAFWSFFKKKLFTSCFDKTYLNNFSEANPAKLQLYVVFVRTKTKGHQWWRPPRFTLFYAIYRSMSVYIDIGQIGKFEWHNHNTLAPKKNVLFIFRMGAPINVKSLI